MAPFPEAEDMTVKRLYVALKRDDMQLLQMGAHKLHEKYHTGYKFQLLDDLRQILSYVEEQQIPNDIKELLIKTINDILDNKEPENLSYTEDEAVEEEKQEVFEEKNEPINQGSNLESEPKEENNFNSGVSHFPLFEENKFEFNTQVENNSTETFSNNFEENSSKLDEESFSQDSSSIENGDIKEEGPVIFTPKDAVIDMVNKIDDEPISALSDFKPQAEPETPSFKIIQEDELTLNNVAVFYDDKAPFIDYLKNKSFRHELDSILLKNDGRPLEDAAICKNTVDIQTDEFSEILKMLNTIKGEVCFVTTSKSENLLNTFVNLGVNFEIPNVITTKSEGKKVELIPLFGLSDIFYCPKCGRRETVINKNNKILTTQCRECSGVMYPDLYEALNFETNANPYYFISGIKAMANAETWILINPPLESSRALTSYFLKSAFEVSKPKKVYILSKETTKKEYYKQMFLEINSSTEVKTDFITEDSLCEEFIYSEMSTIKVTA